MTAAPAALDEFERRILRALQSDGRLSVNELSERIGLSARSRSAA